MKRGRKAAGDKRGCLLIRGDSSATMNDQFSGSFQISQYVIL